jgi:outer membrane protein assembly factor BamB
MRRPGLRFAVAAAALGLAASAIPAAAAATPRPLPGWPVDTPAGTVHRGPDRGVVVISRDGFDFAVTALRRDGRRLWRSARRASCGNCDEGPQPERLQPDGTYGPIGAEGDDVWAVDRRGRVVTGCSGAVSADGTCVFGGSSGPGPTPPVPFLAAALAGTRLWTVEVPGLSWLDEFDVPPVVGRDDAGRAYAAFGRPTELTTGIVLAGRLVALDPAAQVVVWDRTGPGGVLTALRSGVLASEGAGLVALRADGGVTWTRPIAAGQTVSAADVAYDARRDRVYLGRRGRHPGVTALDGATGAQLWRTTTRDRARLLSAGARGPVYVAVDTPGATGIRAVRLSGAVKWQRRTGRLVTGAAELANGTVAVSAGSGFPAPGAGILSVLDPR